MSGASGRPGAMWGLTVLLSMVAAMAWASPSRAQYASRKFVDEPILVNTGEGHTAPVEALVFDPDTGRLLSGGDDKVIHVWGPAEDGPRPLQTLRPPIWRGFGGSVWAMAISPVADAQGQRWLAVAGYGVAAQRGEILLYRYPGIAAQATGDLVKKLPPTQDGGLPIADPGHTEPVRALAFSPDGRRLASAGRDGSARVWDLATGTAIVLNVGPGEILRGVAFTPDGRLVVTGGNDGLLRLWDPSRPARPIHQVGPFDARDNGRLARSSAWRSAGMAGP